MRNTFIQELAIAAESNKNIALVVGDLGYGVVEPFADKFPERFFNAGVAEQNMMGMAAGMASEGMHVFVYSIANFPTFRCAEQIRNDVAYHNLPVTIVAVGGGLAYGNLGYSHHAVQDYGLMRMMPNLLIASPGDPIETKACMDYLVKNPQPSYLRLGKSGEPCIHKTLPKVAPGEWLIIREGKKGGKAYLSTGATLELINRFSDESDSVLSMPLWNMHSKDLQVNQVNKYSTVVTVEDHLIDCGMGSWMLEALVNRPDLMVRLKIKGLNSKVCGMVGKQATLNHLGGLNQGEICA